MAVKAPSSNRWTAREVPKLWSECCLNQVISLSLCLLEYSLSIYYIGCPVYFREEKLEDISVHKNGRREEWRWERQQPLQANFPIFTGAAKLLKISVQRE